MLLDVSLLVMLSLFLLLFSACCSASPPRSFCHAGGFARAALHAYGLSLGWTLGHATLHCTSVLPESYLMPQGLGRCARRVIQSLLHCTSVLSEASCRKALGGGKPTHGRWCARNYQHLQGCVPFVGGLIPAWDARQARIPIRLAKATG